MVPVQVSDRRLQATLPRAGGPEPDKTYEVKALELQGSDEFTIAMLVGGRDFPRLFFRTRAHPDEPAMTAEDVAAAAYQIEKEREAQFVVPLGDADDLETVEFRVLMLVERLRLTNYMRVPGIELLPLSAGNAAIDEARIVNQVLAELGWNAGVNLGWWAETSSRERPVLLIRVPF